MGSAAPKSVAAARRVARRALIADSIRRGGTCLLAGAAGSLLAVGTARLAGLDWHWGWLVGVPMAMGGATALALSASRRWDAMRGAIRAERTLGLGSRVSTAMSLADEGRAGSTPIGGFELLAIADGESAAARIDPRAVVPIRWGRPWRIWPVVLAGGVAAGMLVPPARWSKESAAQDPALATARTEASTRVAEAAETVREVTGGNEDTPGASTEDLAALESLERELAQGSISPDEARARAARAVESTASRLEDRAERDLEADRALRERLALAARDDAAGPPPGLSPRVTQEGAGPNPGSDQSADSRPGDAPTGGAPAATGSPAGRELERAMGEGDLESSRRAIQDIRRQVDRMTPEQRESLAQRLREMAERLEESREAEPPAPASAPGAEPPPGATPPSDWPLDQGANDQPADRSEDPAISGAPEGTPTQPEQSTQAPASQTDEPESGQSQSGQTQSGQAPEGQQPGQQQGQQPGQQQGREQGQAGAQRSPSQSGQSGQPGQNSTGQRPEGGEPTTPEGTPRPGESPGDSTRQRSAPGMTSPGVPNEPGDQAQADRQDPRTTTGARTGERADGGPSPEPSSGAASSSDDGSAQRARELEQRGLSPDAAREAARQTDPQAIRERLEREGVDPGSADRLARQIAQENREDQTRREGQRQADQDARDLSESMRDAARALQRSADEQRPANDRAERNAAQPERPDPQQDGEPPGPGAERPDQPDPGRPGQGTSGQDPQRGAPGQEPRQSPQGERPEPSGGGARAAPVPGSDPTRDVPGRSEPTGAGGRGEGRSGEASTGRSGEAGGDGQGPGVGDDLSAEDIDRALDALERNLGRAADRRSAVRDRLQDSEALREQADRLLERTTPEQRERLSRLSRELARREWVARPPGASESETVEASRRDESAREQVISQWLGEAGDERVDPAARGRVLQERVRDAAAGAERAVESQEVPSRYSDLVRRVFRRYQERAEGASRVEDAPDAAPR